MGIMKTFRKVAGILITTSLCFTMFAGCGSGNTESEAKKKRMLKFQQLELKTGKNYKCGHL